MYHDTTTPRSGTIIYKQANIVPPLELNLHLLRLSYDTKVIEKVESGLKTPTWKFIDVLFTTLPCKPPRIM